MRRRFFWSTTAVVAFVLVLVGIGLVLLLQNLATRATREEMARQAIVIELIVEQQFQAARAEGVALERLAELFNVDQGPSDRVAQARRSFGVFLRSLLEAARDIAGGSRVELGLLDGQGRIRSFAGDSSDGFLETVTVDSALLHAGSQQFVVHEPTEGQGGSLVVLVHPFSPVGGRTLEGTVLLALVRESPVIDWGRIIQPLLLTLAAAAALAALIARLLSRWLVSRLDRLSHTARRIADGDVAARVPQVEDNELQDLSQAFNDMADRLEEGRAREREFLMSVGHDLRTPLTTIGGYAEALEDAPSSRDELHRIGTVLAAETGRLRRLVDDLMLLARLEAREFSLSPELVDVAAHVREVAEGFRPRAENAHVRLEVDVAETGMCEIDPDRLAQICGNLLENALRYTPEAGAVRIQAKSSDGRIELVVSDSGTGIDPADVPHAFEKFYVARKYRRMRPEGSGLGLSIVERLTKAMKGTVSLDSTVGEGTRVTVSLPVRGN